MQVFKELTPSPIAAASLGQVGEHHASAVDRLAKNLHKSNDLLLPNCRILFCAAHDSTISKILITLVHVLESYSAVAKGSHRLDIAV